MQSIGSALSNIAVNQINKVNLDNFKSAEKLTSGIQINQAADDAAGLAISTGFQTMLQSGKAVSKGLNDGISYTQVASGALSEVQSLLQRARELSLQSMNGTYTDKNREQMNVEYNQIKAEIDRIAETTSFNGVYPLKNITESPPSPTQTLEVHTSWTVDFEVDTYVLDPSGDGMGFNFDLIGVVDSNGDSLSTDSGGSTNSSLITGANNEYFYWNNGAPEGTYRVYIDNFAHGASYNFPFDVTIDFNANGITKSQVVTVPANTRTIGPIELSYDLDQFGLTEQIDILSEISPSGDESFISINKTGSTVEDLRLGVVYPKDGREPYASNISTAENAKDAAGILDAAIDKVSDYQAYYGAKSNALEKSFSRLQIQMQNIASSKSQVYDADYAKESANLARTHILQNSAGSMLSHINQSKSDVLQLLTGLTN